MDKKFLKYIGHDLYNVKKLKERKRYIVFRIRCGLHKSQIGALLDFFQTTPLRREMLKHTTSFVEQTTRAFFYKGSTWDERIAIVKNHIEYMENISSVIAKSSDVPRYLFDQNQTEAESYMLMANVSGCGKIHMKSSRW